MEKSEIAFFKQSLFAIRDWDTFQAVMKKYRELIEHSRKKQEYKRSSE